MSARPTSSISSIARRRSSSSATFSRRGRAASWPLFQSALFLDFLAGNQTYHCTPWGNPTRTVFGWQRPCYLLGEGYAKTFKELMEDTDWDKYGTGNYEKCADCMVHCGFEATAVMDAVTAPVEVRAKVALKGVKTEGPMAPDIPLDRQRPAEYVFSRHVEQKLAEIAKPRPGPRSRWQRSRAALRTASLDRSADELRQLTWVSRERGEHRANVDRPVRSSCRQGRRRQLHARAGSAMTRKTAKGSAAQLRSAPRHGFPYRPRLHPLIGIKSRFSAGRAHDRSTPAILAEICRRSAIFNASVQAGSAE